MEKNLINPGSIITVTVPQEGHGKRIDTFLSDYFQAYSRTFFQQLVEQSYIKLNNKTVKKPSLLLKDSDIITVQFPHIVNTYEPKEIPGTINVEVIFEHPQFLIINKPPGLLVHAPNLKSQEVNLVDWLLTHYGEIKSVGAAQRLGIVHRLDKDTSGLMIIPRNSYAHALFNTLFKNRQIHKTYLAVVQGHPPGQGTIDFPVGRDPHTPIKMTHKNLHGRSAITHFKVLRYFKDAALVELKPVTGRTHQIRVHCAAIGHPIIGDKVYGKKSSLIERQALHAAGLEFLFEEKPYSFTVQPPADFQQLINHLEKTI